MSDLIDRIERQKKVLADERRRDWRHATEREHAEALRELLDLTDRLYAGRDFPDPEPRSAEALALWETLVRQGHR